MSAIDRARIDDGCRSELYLGLARGLDAGFDASRALHAVSGVCGGVLDARIAASAAAVARGRPLKASLEHQGLLTPPDAALLEPAERAGRIDAALATLAVTHERRHVRWRRFKGRMLLPAFVLVLAFVVQPLPAVFAGTLSGGGYVALATARLAALAVLALAGRALLRRWSAVGWPRLLTGFARRLPVLATLTRLHERHSVAERLWLLLESGVPVHDAFGILVRIETDASRRARLAAARAGIEGGRGLAGALRQASLVDPSGDHAIVQSAEAAGRITDALERVRDGAEASLDLRYDLIAQWTPVVIYAMVAGYVASGFF